MKSYWGVDHGVVSKAYLGGGRYAPVTSLPRNTITLLKHPGVRSGGDAVSRASERNRLANLQNTLRRSEYERENLPFLTADSRNLLKNPTSAQRAAQREAASLVRMHRKAVKGMRFAGKNPRTGRTANQNLGGPPFSRSRPRTTDFVDELRPRKLP